MKCTFLMTKTCFTRVNLSGAQEPLPAEAEYLLDTYEHPNVKLAACGACAQKLSDLGRVYKVFRIPRTS